MITVSAYIKHHRLWLQNYRDQLITYLATHLDKAVFFHIISADESPETTPITNETIKKFITEIKLLNQYIDHLNELQKHHEMKALVQGEEIINSPIHSNVLFKNL